MVAGAGAVVGFSLENRCRTSSQDWCPQSSLFSKTPGVKPDRETTSSGRPLNEVTWLTWYAQIGELLNHLKKFKPRAQSMLKCQGTIAVRAATTSSGNRSWASMMQGCSCISASATIAANRPKHQQHEKALTHRREMWAKAIESRV